MVFSSIIFLFAFLPLALGLYLLTPARMRNAMLLLASCVFYFWGENVLVAVLLGSSAFNYLCGLLMAQGEDGKLRILKPGGSRDARQKGALIGSLVISLGVLAYFKYSGFLIENVNDILSLITGRPESLDPEWAAVLPLGISFYTFQSLSYTIDVYRGQVKATGNLTDFLCYVTMFPQLVAGPIVRYKDIAEQLASRSENTARFASGIRRFAVGLGKKVLIANIVGRAADQVFALPLEAMSPALAWTGAICYSLQIYYDFSGYSDMAIGLGRMMGFELPENFNYPYISRSVQEFWRRWHMTLSTWFKDYLYIPLGGNRKGPWRTYFNLVTVFLLCGLWHGASWTFVAWGLYHGFFLVLERLGLGSLLKRLWQPLQHAYAMVAVLFGWILFRADDFSYALGYMAAALGLGPTPSLTPPSPMTNDVALALFAGLAFSAPLAPWLRDKARTLAGQNGIMANILPYGSTLGHAALLFASALMVSAGTHNPFLYFRF